MAQNSVITRVLFLCERRCGIDTDRYVKQKLESERRRRLKEGKKEARREVKDRLKGEEKSWKS